MPGTELDLCALGRGLDRELDLGGAQNPREGRALDLLLPDGPRSFGRLACSGSRPEPMRRSWPREPGSSAPAGRIRSEPRPSPSAATSAAGGPGLRRPARSRWGWPRSPAGRARQACAETGVIPQDAAGRGPAADARAACRWRQDPRDARGPRRAVRPSASAATHRAAARADRPRGRRRSGRP